MEVDMHEGGSNFDEGDSDEAPPAPKKRGAASRTTKSFKAATSSGAGRGRKEATTATATKGRTGRGRGKKIVDEVSTTILK
jgi:hypothetical protein